MYAYICRGSLLSVSAEHSGICICIDRFILFFIKPRRDFGIAQDIVLGLMPVTAALPKVHPKEGALVQITIFVFAQGDAHTHLRLLWCLHGVIRGHGRMSIFKAPIYS